MPALGGAVFQVHIWGEYGVYVSNSGEAVRHRKALGMEHLKLLFKVNPEADAYLVQQDIQVVARSIMFGDFADGLCVSGAAAGAEPDDVVLSRVHEAAKQKNVPVFCNTGCNHQNVREKLKHCDAVCIGSAFKRMVFLTSGWMKNGSVILWKLSKRSAGNHKEM